ncbi:aspartyl/asparaginyl beta-hydroxylase domain-containing protein [uncultured Brevundimonas sp.]|uniref:aspartyl/asparaginyl beta-hydroxylase domain-containing protein n=1 Tax=uncultured Brevundimonas sp. TaxID=213418 RepID=UPI000FB06A65|nr:aspartyl/asparaginyl beta-hydroxylase domain-containing protein [uncultured Brevundimonas sp.]
MIDRFRLPLAVDVEALRADLIRLGDAGWTPHFNRDYYDGDWSGLVLRAPPGHGDSLYTGGGDGVWQDAPAMDQCHGARALLEQLGLDVRSVRLLRLGAGAEIKEHRDYGLGAREGEARLHVPIITNPSVAFRVRNRPVDMRPGEIWYLDLGQPHRVHNAGPTDRIHLVIDVAANAQLRTWAPFDQVDPEVQRVAEILNATSPETSARNFAAFRERMLSDAALHVELAAIRDRRLFIEETVRLGVESDLPFAEAEVETALIDGRNRWNQPWS